MRLYKGLKLWARDNVSSHVLRDEDDLAHNFKSKVTAE